MFELYSMRHKAETNRPEAFVYNSFPSAFRNQFFAIVKDVFDKPLMNYEYIWGPACKAFAREKGLKAIYGYYGMEENSEKAFEYYVDHCDDREFLDLMDYVFSVIISNPSIQMRFFDSRSEFFSGAIDELNLRLKQHNLGYEFYNREIIKKTNTITHEKIVRPALQLLCDEAFRGAEDEYMSAWRHFTKNENKEAIVDAEKAFESTMKTICSRMGFSFDPDRDDAKKLLDVLKNNNFFPPYLESHLNTVVSSLQSGAPTVRNRTSGHGQGEDVKEVHENYAAYVLNLVASNIVFLHSIYVEETANSK